MVDAIGVLHVDDDEEFAELTATFLERADERFDVDIAGGPEEALSRLEAAEFDCVVSDHDMPGRNGIELLRAVREPYPDLPFVLFTGKGSEAVASDAISAGVTDYLQKRTGTEQYELLANRVAGAVERYRAERTLERQNDLFERAQAIANVGAWEYDLSGGAGHVSEEVLRIHGLSPDDDLAPEESIEHYHPEDRPAIRRAIRRAIDDGEPYDLELRLVDDNGDQRWVQTCGQPQSRDGEVVRLRGTFQDITERKRRERDLQRQKERVEEFAEVVSREVRSAVEAANECLETAKRVEADSALQEAREAHGRIEATVDGALALVEHGERATETESVAVDDIAREAHRAIDPSPVRLATIGDPRIEADPDRLRKLFAALLDNAVKHAADDFGNLADGHVTVSVGPVDKMPTTTRSKDVPAGFYVADDGPGIPNSVRDRIFDPGVTVGDDGTGFGLAVVAQIADAHGWSVTATDSRDGGTRFEFVERSSTGRTSFDP